jgi:hypothetical protein
MIIFPFRDEEMEKLLSNFSKINAHLRLEFLSVSSQTLFPRGVRV